MAELSADEAAILAAKPYTLTRYVRRRAMANAVLRIDREGIAGDVVECGVWRGGNIILARLLSPERTCWLFDTFTGMTPPGPEDVHHRGRPAAAEYQRRQDAGLPWCVASLADVREGMQATGTLDDARCRFVVGDVAETLRDPANIPEGIAVLRLDTDWYASTRLELDMLYPRLAPGGALIVDDYGHWNGARRAVDEYFAGTGAEFTPIDYSAVMMTKPC